MQTFGLQVLEASHVFASLKQACSVLRTEEIRRSTSARGRSPAPSGPTVDNCPAHSPHAVCGRPAWRPVRQLPTDAPAPHPVRKIPVCSSERWHGHGRSAVEVRPAV